ncbi:MAG: rhodanese-like domain-containing protein [Candidatus Omnitrophica bacterium]|nr:rhodanese-like domain-containing protein [Candidatus Omnitrophota bacterium]
MSKEIPLTVDMTSLTDDQLKEFVFVDVREPQERALEPAPGIESVHLPLSQFQQRKFVFDPGKEYIIFCAKGMRSESLTEYLHEQGITNVRSLDGGMDAIERRFQKS